MAWHMLILMSGVIKGPRALTEEHSAGDPNPGEEDMILPIRFIFKDGSLYECNVNINDFGCFDTYRVFEERKRQSVGTGTEYTEEPITIQLNMINDNKMFLQFKMFWEQETSDGLSDIDANEFYSFLEDATHLGIRGDTYKRLARNMARMGLRGEHSQDILRHIDEYLCSRAYAMFWDLFLGLAAELECEVRKSGKVVTLCSIGSVEYGDIAGTRSSLDGLRVAPDAFSRNKNVGTHIAHHLFWLLWYLNLDELDLSGCKMDENDVDALSKAEDVGLQAMNVSQCSMPPGSLARILPHLKDLTKLHAHDNSLNEADCDALAASTLLTELGIRYCFEDSPGSIARILPRLKDLTKLDAAWNRLNEADRNALAKCTKLTELSIINCLENSPGCLAIILPHLKYLTKLDVAWNSLNKADCDALAACTKLTELGIRCCSMTPGCLAIILLHLKYLTKLHAGGNRLNEADRNAFAKCTLLTELSISHCSGNSSGYLARILPHLKHLTKLYIRGNSLNEADRDALAKCTLLTELNVSHCSMTPGCLAIILPHLKYLTKLYVSGNSLNEADREAKKAARERGTDVRE
jgi:Leucine-rich repeat (LRR) protein